MPLHPTSDPSLQGHPAPAGEGAWALLLALSGLRRSSGLPDSEMGVRLAADRELCWTEADDPRAQLIRHRDGAFVLGSGVPPAARDLYDLYLPWFAANEERPVVVGHLGQSVDAQIATESGDSCYVTGRENLIHMHRMRALCDAVVVGAQTVASDDPRLTTRLVSGPNPVRVVIDPRRRLSPDRRLFQDGQASTLVACEEERAAAGHQAVPCIGVPPGAEGLSIDALVAALTGRGLHALFVEGGGVTITRWMQAGQLDRLQIATAPVLIGAGRPALRLPAAPNMASCLRPAFRIFRMGKDILWDFDLRAGALGESPAAEDQPADAPLRVL